MTPHLTREFITDALAESVLDPRARALYDLCFMHRNHLRDEIVADKLRLIGRLNIGSGAAQAFSPEFAAHCLAKSPVDRWFSTLATAEDLDTALMLESHKRVMDVFADLSEAEARTLASRYLHFHFPELFFIHDSVVEQAARELAQGDCGFLALADFDPHYGQFFACSRRLCERLTPMVGRRLSPRELDRVLRAWQAQTSYESLVTRGELPVRSASSNQQLSP